LHEHGHKEYGYRGDASCNHDQLASFLTAGLTVLGLFFTAGTCSLCAGSGIGYEVAWFGCDAPNCT
jgi:hypothetical protein